MAEDTFGGVLNLAVKSFIIFLFTFMKKLLLIPILLITGCSSSAQEPVDQNPEQQNPKYISYEFLELEPSEYKDQEEIDPDTCEIFTKDEQNIYHNLYEKNIISDNDFYNPTDYAEYNPLIKTDIKVDYNTFEMLTDKYCDFIFIKDKDNVYYYFPGAREKTYEY
jgi:hypothetical protein